MPDRLPVLCEPARGLLPDHDPPATQAVALVETQDKVPDDPLTTVLGTAPRLTVGTAGATETTSDWVVVPPGPVQLKV